MINRIKPDEKIVGLLNKNRLQNLNVLGYLQNVEGTSALIFNNDTDNGIILADGDGGGFFVATESEAFLRGFWDSLAAGRGYFFRGVPENMADTLFSIAGKPVWKNPCDVFALTGDNPLVPNTEYGRHSLTAEDAREVDNYYTYKSEDSYQSILDSIENRPSECLRIDGELAAWILTHDDNSMGPLYVKEKYRGRQFAKILSERLMEKLLAKGIQPFCHIVQGNKASLANAHKIAGFNFTHVCVWFGLEKR